jgi:hypothetical protein
MIFKNHGQGNILFQLCRSRILFSFQSLGRGLIWL